jgi:hypothetical protein
VVIDPFSVEEVEALIGALRDSASRSSEWMLAELIAYSGARPQDALALSYGRIGTQRIVYAEKNIDGRIVGGSKTGQDRARSVTLLASLRKDLLAFRLAAGNPSDDALVLPRAVGKPWRLHDYKNWQRNAVKAERSSRPASIFAAAATAIGRSDATPYFLRHTYASLRLAEQRLSLQEIAEEMGHTVEVLARTYAHVIAEYRGQGPSRPRSAHQNGEGQEENAPKPPQARLPTAGTSEADGGTRTPDPIITSDVLYQLSYVGAVGSMVATDRVPRLWSDGASQGAGRGVACGRARRGGCR